MIDYQFLKDYLEKEENRIYKIVRNEQKKIVEQEAKLSRVKDFIRPDSNWEAFRAVKNAQVALDDTLMIIKELQNKRTKILEQIEELGKFTS